MNSAAQEFRTGPVAEKPRGIKGRRIFRVVRVCDNLFDDEAGGAAVRYVAASQEEVAAIVIRNTHDVAEAYFARIRPREHTLSGSNSLRNREFGRLCFQTYCTSISMPPTSSATMLYSHAAMSVATNPMTP